MSNEPEWQLVFDDTWIFGLKIRGIVRQRLAEVWFDPDCLSREGGWHWLAYNTTPPRRGIAANRSLAIWEAEKRLGIVSDD